MECALKHVETQMDNLLLAMGDDPLSPEVAITCLCSILYVHALSICVARGGPLKEGPSKDFACYDKQL